MKIIFVSKTFIHECEKPYRYARAYSEEHFSHDLHADDDEADNG